MRLTRVFPAALGLALVASACGDSTEPQLPLDDAEVLAIFEEVSSVLEQAGAPASFQMAATPSLASSWNQLPGASFASAGVYG